MAAEHAVIFDVDGVLVDSYQAHFESWLALADRTGGYRLSEAEFAATFGQRTADVVRAKWPAQDLDDATVEAYDDLKESLFRETLSRAFPAMPGAEALIQQLDNAGWLLGVGSSGPAENVTLVLEALGQRDRFGAVVTARDVSRGKPHPDVFLVAAERLGIAPQQAIVIEDAPAGVAAAHAAGARCVGFASTGRTPEQLAEADHIIRDLRELSVDSLRALLDATPST